MLLPRQDRVRCRSWSPTRGYYNCYRRPWSSWGRWVFLAGIILLFLVFFILACVSARRRRKAGMTPFRGTGWMGGPPPGHGPAVYTGPQGAPAAQSHYGPTPPYLQTADPAPQYTTAPPPQGYYGGNNNNSSGGGASTRDEGAERR